MSMNVGIQGRRIGLYGVVGVRNMKMELLDPNQANSIPSFLGIVDGCSSAGRGGILSGVEILDGYCEIKTMGNFENEYR